MLEKLHRINEILIREQRSAYWLAKRTGISNNSIHGYVHGKIEPSLTNLYRIADALNVDIKDLLVPNK
jgi:putative transcriptional regulator